MSAVVDRRLRRVAIDEAFLVSILKGSLKHGLRDVIESNLPADAEVVWVFADPTRPAIVVVMASAEFEPVERGVEIPELHVTYRRTILEDASVA